MAVLVAQGTYILGFALISAWWIWAGAPAPVSGGCFMNRWCIGPYRTSELGFIHSATMALAAPVAIASITAARIALERAPREARKWPEVMTYVSVITAIPLVPLGILGALGLAPSVI